MKIKLYYLIAIILCLSCKGREEVTQNDIFNTSFKNYNEISALEGFEKISDTSVDTQKTGDNFRLLHLKKDSEIVILFYKKVTPNENNLNSPEYKALDTLRISELDQFERFTIGYCTKEGLIDEQIIAVVKDTTGLYMDVVKSWKANLETQKIEVMEDLVGLKCLNEFYESEEEVIDLENFREE